MKWHFPQNININSTKVILLHLFRQGSHNDICSRSSRNIFVVIHGLHGWLRLGYRSCSIRARPHIRSNSCNNRSMLHEYLRSPFESCSDHSSGTHQSDNSSGKLHLIKTWVIHYVFIRISKSIDCARLLCRWVTWSDIRICLTQIDCSCQSIFTEHRKSGRRWILYDKFE